MKSKLINIVFILTNFIGTVFEYYLFYLLFVKLFFIENTDMALSLTLIVMILYVILNVVASRIMMKMPKNIEISEMSDDLKILVDRLTSKFKEVTGKEVVFRYIDNNIIPAPLMAMGKNVYINVNEVYSYKTINDVHLEGGLTHELGHVLHMSKMYGMASMRISTYINTLLQGFITGLFKKIPKDKQSFLWVIIGILYPIYMLTGYLNHFIVFPFMRYEEFKADELSLNFSNGYALRGYYYNIIKYKKADRFSLIRKYVDFRHPAIIKMYQSLNEHMIKKGITNNLCEIVNNRKIDVEIYSDQKEKLQAIVDFYETCLDKELKSLYSYIADTYYQLEDYENAKKYYLLMDYSNRVNILRKLKTISIKQGNIQDVISFNTLLIELGDKDAIMSNQYYEHEFVLSEHLLDDGTTISVDKSKTLKFSYTGICYIKDELKISEYRFSRKGNSLILMKELEPTFIYTMKEGSILSQTILQIESNKEISFKEIYIVKLQLKQQIPDNVDISI